MMNYLTINKHSMELLCLLNYMPKNVYGMTKIHLWKACMMFPRIYSNEAIFFLSI